MNDYVRAAILATVQSIFPVLQIVGIVTLTSDEIATVMLFVGNGLTLAALVFTKGQSERPPLT